MLTLIHGNDIVASRKFFLEQKQKQPENILLEEQQVDLTDLTQILEGGGLFGESKHIFIESFLSKRKKSKEKDAIVSYLVEQRQTHHIWLWEGKELERSVLNLFKTANVKNFPLPSTLFVFLDALRPGNGRQLIRLFHQTLETTEVEMVFFMLVRHFRIFLALMEPGDMIIDEARRLATWQRGKVEKQAFLFGADALKQHFQSLFEIEVGQKTGTLASPMTFAIDFFLLEI
jgi:DNA polymerase III delta subunit